jgi:hypothetical protein
VPMNCSDSGYFCPNGTISPQPCKAGYYCPRPTEMIICPKGSFCKGNLFVCLVIVQC